MGAGKSEGPDPEFPRPGKANVGFVVEVPMVVAGVGWLVGNGNAGAVLEVVVVIGGGATGLEKKLGTAGGSGFVVGAGEVVGVGLAKKFGTAGCGGTGFEGVDVGNGVAKRFLAGSLVSVIVDSAAGFDCLEAAESGADKLGIVGIVVLGVEVVVVGVGEGFLSTTVFFVS